MWASWVASGLLGPQCLLCSRQLYINVGAGEAVRLGVGGSPWAMAMGARDGSQRLSSLLPLSLNLNLVQQR